MDISTTNRLLDPVAVPTGAAALPPVPAEQRALIRAVRAVNAAEMFGQENELTFILDRETHRAVVRIVNRDTGEVVQQIPDEHVLRMAEEISGT